MNTTSQQLAINQAKSYLTMDVIFNFLLTAALGYGAFKFWKEKRWVAIGAIVLGIYTLYRGATQIQTIKQL